MPMWEPWRGCHKISEGCQFCYIHKGDAKRGVDTNCITKSKRLNAPLECDKLGNYKMKAGQTVFVCFSSDFLLEEADEWRKECFDIMKKRQDLHFVFLTKRIHRLSSCLPEDWGDGYDNVTIGCTVENQKNADNRLPIFKAIPIRHRNIICQPLLEAINLRPYLEGVECVIVGGESDKNARVLNYDWVLDIRNQCLEKGIHFQFRQCGTHFVKDGKAYTLKVKDLCTQAKKANIDV